MNTHYTIVTVVVFFVLILMELFRPARVYKKSDKVRSYTTNSQVFIINNVVTYLLQISLVFVIVSSWSPAVSYFSLLPLWLQAVLGVIILDFSIWVWHFLNHQVPFLWRFHKCHHSERYLNATSAVRFHLGEIILSVLWKALTLIIFGIPLWVFLLSEFLITLFAAFHHSNIVLPSGVERKLSRLIITPYLHRVHHSERRREHDTNFGVILSWWDYLFKTRCRVEPERIGLAKVKSQNLKRFLIFPWQK